MGSKEGAQGGTTWSSRTEEDDPGAPFFNDTQKYVVSSTLTEPTWRSSTTLDPYDPEAIRQLKADVAGDVYVSGSGMLVRAMLADGLVDELHLFVFPLTRGTGPRLFAEGTPLAQGLHAVRERCDPSWVCALPSNGVKPG